MSNNEAFIAALQQIDVLIAAASSMSRKTATQLRWLRTKTEQSYCSGRPIDLALIDWEIDQIINHYSGPDNLDHIRSIA